MVFWGGEAYFAAPSGTVVAGIEEVPELRTGGGSVPDTTSGEAFAVFPSATFDGFYRLGVGRPVVLPKLAL